MSIDQFYELVTKEEDAFYQMCMALPKVIKKTVSNELDNKIPHDTVIDELRRIAESTGDESEDIAMAIAIYLLGFSTYKGFPDLAGYISSFEEREQELLQRLYMYAKVSSNFHPE